MALIDKWIYYIFDEVSSTNDVIKQYCSKSGKYIAVYAKKQTSGRGRRGRNWDSPRGNLFFSMAFEYELQRAGELAFACSLSLLQAVKKIAPYADIKLKWPNDVLLNNAKMSGILLEKGAEKYMIVGVGVNAFLALRCAIKSFASCPVIPNCSSNISASLFCVVFLGSLTGSKE